MVLDGILIVLVHNHTSPITFQKVQPYIFSLDPLYSTSDSIGHPLVAKLFLIGLASHQMQGFSNISQLNCSTESTVLFHKSKEERHHDSQTQDSQTSTTTQYRCHQILPVFGLNNSYGKIIHIGLENTSIGSDDFNTVVQLSNNEFYGLSLPLAAWLQFWEQFDEIDLYFQGYSEEDILDQQITYTRFYIRFMISYSDQAFELLENEETKIRKDFGESRAKKVRKPSLVFKRVTFDRFKWVKRHSFKH
ncbi:hypothetical protein TSAR_006297 [Trichomalopsis sarcophagae]|uniref:Uncharacterized protein n=1 Tax=Trichomalopsis sarcophagae TaxID=543379 RepID=A0A232F0N8_9HYME|nr:hypothetical protein TSAR_006297 [Trichomalopsis sarcophagae]